MRVVMAVLVAGLLASPAVLSAPRASAASASSKKQPKKKPSSKKGAAASAGEGLDNPYAASSDADAEPGEASAPPAATDTGGAPVSGDPKLDAPPTAAASTGEGPRPSPLNPEADEFPHGEPAPGPAELDALLSDIASLRGRVAALTTSLFSSKLRVYVRTEGDDARVDSFVVTLDDGVVFTAEGQFVAEDDRVVYEHAVAPGNHVLGVEVERHDARGKGYRTWQSTRLSIVVPDKKLLEVDLRIEDDSDMAEDFPDDEDGEYELDVRARARVVE
jgi:hypothetical protein